MDIQIRENERIDDIGFGGLKVIQTEGLGYGVDSILLAAFAAGETGAKAVRKGSGVADLGSGSGIIGFVLQHKVENIKVTGIEKRSNAVDRAVRGALLNDISDHVTFVQSDVNGYVANVEYDAVVSNPPYFRRNAAIPSATDDKFVARHETTADIGDFVRTMAGILKAGGDCYIVHRPDRLADIFTEMRNCGIEPKTMQLVVPRAGEAANIVLVHGVKGAGRELKLLPDIAVHSEDGGYTDAIERIYERQR